MAGMGNDLVKEARKRAALTQRELAERAGTTQSAIARLETGRTTPSFDTVVRLVRLVRLCGLELEVALHEDDGSDWAQAVRLLRLTPARRVEHMVETASTMLRIQGEARRRHGAA